MFVDTNYSDARLNASDLSLSSRLKLSRINLAIGAEQLRERFFLRVSDEADGYFVSSPLEWSF